MNSITVVQHTCQYVWNIFQGQFKAKGAGGLASCTLLLQDLVDRGNFLREMTGGIMFMPLLGLEGRFNFAADILRHWASSMETAACWKIDRAGEITGKDDTVTVFFDLRIRNGYGRE